MAFSHMVTLAVVGLPICFGKDQIGLNDAASSTMPKHLKYHHIWKFE